MSKRKKTVLSVTAVIFVLCIFACIFLFKTGTANWLYYRGYTGSRITLNLFVTKDGEQIKADEVKATVTSDSGSEHSGNKVSVEDNENSVQISVKGGEYGEYLIETEICNYHFNFRAMQWNWWDVQNINLYLDMDTAKNECKIREEYSYISEQADYTAVYESEPEATYEMDKISYISVGCKG